MSTNSKHSPRLEKEINLDNGLHPLVNEFMSRDVLSGLLALRFINALSVITFFQPDEYYQALEPAWQMAFGSGSGAWITWEWHNQLRSSLHPAIFGALYLALDKPMEWLEFFPQFRGLILAAMPCVMQSICAALGDFYTWRLAERIYGRGSNTAWAALILTILSPWQWFCSTRTFSNSLETTLTITALNFWQWDLGGVVTSRKKAQAPKSTDTVNSLRISLLCAGLACILRPTNLLVWASLVTVSIVSSKALFENISSFSILLRETIICGSVVLAISATSDFFFYGIWTFPPYQWLNFNITQSLAVFYGTNDWHYYISQGVPQLLTTYLPWGILALISSTSLTASSLPVKTSVIRFQLAFMILTMIATLSLISHKEVRFIYPLLPSLHILLAPHILSFLSSIPKSTTTPPTPKYITTILNPHASITIYKLKLLPLLLLNLSIAYYTTRIHQSGVLSVMTFLRDQYAEIHMNYRGQLLSTIDGGMNTATSPTENFAAFLTPCHSTPWRSHLIYPSLNAWALTCEPPLHIPASSPARATYRDEADRFFDNQTEFLAREVGLEGREWPRYVVGFEGSLDKKALEGAWRGDFQDGFWREKEKKKKEKELVVVWRGFNTHWIDDWRREGDVVVWQLKDREEEE